jgi:hypothetical protein
LNRSFDFDKIETPVRKNLTCLAEFFSSHGLLEKKNSSFAPTSNGLLRVEEMSYFFAEEQVRNILASSKTSRYNYFVTRTPDQEKRFHEAYKTYNERRC